MQKIGILGGSFNPPHMGHRYLAKIAYEKLLLDEIYVIPAYIAPGKKEKDLAPALHRLAMTKLSFQDLEFCQVLSLEIERKGISYTIDTLNELSKGGAEYFLLLGSDQWESFNQWKDAKKILEIARVVVVAREDKQIGESKFPHIWLQVPYIELSSTEIRNKLFSHQNCKDLMMPKVLDYIREHRLYYC